MRTNVLRIARLGAIAAGVALAGCGWLARAGTVKVSAWKSPTLAAAPPRPTQLGPVLDCSGHRGDIAPAATTRAWIADEFFPAVWRRLGAAEAPTAEAPDAGSGLCEHLYDDWYDGTNYEKESGGERLAGIARQLLAGRADANVFVVVFARRSYCYPEKRTVRDASGNPIGSIETGGEVCTENGQFDLAGYLLDPGGHLLYMASGRISHFDWYKPSDVDRAVNAFVGKYPTGAIVADATAAAEAQSSR